MIHPMYAIKQMILHALCLLVIIFSLTLLPCTANAQNSSTETSSIIGEADQLYYTLGTRLKSNDLGDWQNTARIRPVIGLRYGKWQLGIGEAECSGGSGAGGPTTQP